MRLDEEDMIKPTIKFTRFDEPPTCVKLRSDGNLLLSGEKSGKI
jgi:hypothetical protein